jgi:phospholipid/cholesterol/gamma-HCH transport system substrate-binding protein
MRSTRPGSRFLVFLVLTVALTGFIGAQLVDVTFAGRYELTATFDDATGVRTGDEVRIAGVPVGTVREIGVVDGRAHLTLGLRPDVELPSDTAVSISWVDLTGASQLDLHPGREAARLEDGDHIEDTRSTVGVGQLAAEFGAFVGTLDPEQLTELLSSVQQILDGNEDTLVTLVADVTEILGTVGGRGERIEALLADYATLTRTMAGREEQLRAIVDDLAALTAAFDASEQALGHGLDAAATLTGDLGDFLDANQRDLEVLLDDIVTLLALVQPRLDDLEHGLEQLPDTLAELFGTIRHGDYIRVDAVCTSASEPPCPTPRDGLLVPGDEEPDALRELLGGSTP